MWLTACASDDVRARAHHGGPLLDLGVIVHGVAQHLLDRLRAGKKGKKDMSGLLQATAAGAKEKKNGSCNSPAPL